MRLLLNDEWIDAPAPSLVPGAVALEIEATVALAPVPSPNGTGDPVPAPQGRPFRGPRRPREHASQDPLQTRGEPAWRRLSDRRRTRPPGRRAGRPGTPAWPWRCARPLARTSCSATPSWWCRKPRRGRGRPARGSPTALRADLDELLADATQSFLYSGERPPSGLRELVSAAAGSTDPSSAGVTLLRPPAGARSRETSLRLGQPASRWDPGRAARRGRLRPHADHPGDACGGPEPACCCRPRAAGRRRGWTRGRLRPGHDRCP